MQSIAIKLAALSTVALGVIATPAAHDGLSLVKTSASKPAQWITVEEKERLKSEDIPVVDITNIKDPDVLASLDVASSETESRTLQSRQAVQYPSQVMHRDEADRLIASVNNDGPRVWMREMTDFWNRHYRSTNGTIAAQWMFDLAEELSATNPDIEVRQFEHSGFNQPSTIVKVPGETDDLVIVGAHFDSIGSGGSPSGRAPGADDNASGVVVLLEALRILAAAGFKPYNTLEFQFYAGEEGGLLGSADIFSDYKANDASVLAFVNQDMTGYSPSGRISIFTDYVDSGLTAYTRVIAEEYSGLPTTQDRCGYACSDHGSGYSNGFPSAYVCDEVIRTSSPYIHSAQDAYGTIMWPAIQRHSEFTLAFLVEASYLEK